MKLSALLAVIALLISLPSSAAQQTVAFHWQWRQMDQDFSQRPIIRQMKGNSDEVAAIIDAIMGSFGSSGIASVGRIDLQLSVDAANESFEWADLDGNSSPDLIAQAYGPDYCGAVGNCALQVFRRRGATFELLLKCSAQSLMVDRTGKEPLLVLYAHDSATEGELAVYRFPRNQKAMLVYRYEVRWAPLGGPAYSEPHLKPLSINAH